MWLNLLNYLDEAGLRFASLKYVCIGGAAPPASMINTFEEKWVACLKFGAWRFILAWDLGSLARDAGRGRGYWHMTTRQVLARPGMHDCTWVWAEHTMGPWTLSPQCGRA